MEYFLFLKKELYFRVSCNSVIWEIYLTQTPLKQWSEEVAYIFNELNLNNSQWYTNSFPEFH